MLEIPIKDVQSLLSIIEHSDSSLRRVGIGVLCIFESEHVALERIRATPCLNNSVALVAPDVVIVVVGRRLSSSRLTSAIQSRQNATTESANSGVVAFVYDGRSSP